MVVLAVIAVAVVVLVIWSKVRHGRRLRFIEGYAFPPALETKLREHHPDLTTLGASRAIEALREWFVACHHAEGRMLGMPSRVADDAWHEFILMTRLYHEYCKKAFGRYLHHTPDAVSDTPIRPAIPKTLELVERHGPSSAMAGAGALPLLFTVDSELGVDRGRTWTRESVASLSFDTSTEGCLGGGSHLASNNGGCGGCGGCGGGDCG